MLDIFFEVLVLIFAALGILFLAMLFQLVRVSLKLKRTALQGMRKQSKTRVPTSVAFVAKALEDGLRSMDD